MSLVVAYHVPHSHGTQQGIIDTPGFDSGSRLTALSKVDAVVRSFATYAEAEDWLDEVAGPKVPVAWTADPPAPTVHDPALAAAADLLRSLRDEPGREKDHQQAARLLDSLHDRNPPHGPAPDVDDALIAQAVTRLRAVAAEPGLAARDERACLNAAWALEALPEWPPAGMLTTCP